MKTVKLIALLTILLALTESGWAQSTTGGRSGGSTASTGTGYLTEGKRPATTNPQSMTIADEGSSRDYMYVPPGSSPTQKNRSASPDGSVSATSPKQPLTPQQGPDKKVTRQRKP